MPQSRHIFNQCDSALWFINLSLGAIPTDLAASCSIQYNLDATSTPCPQRCCPGDPRPSPPSHHHIIHGSTARLLWARCEFQNVTDQIGLIGNLAAMNDQQVANNRHQQLVDLIWNLLNGIDRRLDDIDQRLNRMEREEWLWSVLDLILF